MDHCRSCHGSYDIGHLCRLYLDPECVEPSTTLVRNNICSDVNETRALTWLFRRLFAYGVTVGSLTIVFVLIQVILVAQRPLLPGVMILLSFILLVLYITGLVETAVQLFGPGNVSDNCAKYVMNNSFTGVSVNTLAWLEQVNICKSFCREVSYEKS